MTRRPIRYAMGVISLLAIGAMAPGLEVVFRTLRHPGESPQSAEARPGDWGLLAAMGPGFASELVLLRW